MLRAIRENTMTDEVPKYAQGRLKLRVLNNDVEFCFDLPIAPAPAEDFLPTIRQTSERFMNMGVAYAEHMGRNVSCTKGCGACCRQLVPLAPTDARALAKFVRTLPEARRAEVTRRVEAGIEQMRSAGVLDRLKAMGTADPDTMQDTAFDYFRAGVPCPFLENEACGIYEDRPLVCREYLVTSDPKLCATPWTGEAEEVAIPFRMNRMLLKLDAADSQAWRPMLLLLRDVLVDDNDPPAGTDRPGEEWLGRIAQALADSCSVNPPPESSE